MSVLLVLETISQIAVIEHLHVSHLPDLLVVIDVGIELDLSKPIEKYNYFSLILF